MPIQQGYVQTFVYDIDGTHPYSSAFYKLVISLKYYLLKASKYVLSTFLPIDQEESSCTDTDTGIDTEN